MTICQEDYFKIDEMNELYVCTGIMQRQCDQCFAFLDVLEESCCCSAVLFMIVSFPEDAAVAICCSIDRVCLAVRAFRAAASLTRAGFLGGCTRFPFLGCDALDDCLDDGALLCNPFEIGRAHV